MPTFTNEDMGEAIRVVETAKQNHPGGFGFLDEIGLDPAPSFVQYAFNMGNAYAERLALEAPTNVYASGWLNGLAIGVALAGARNARA